MKVKNLMLFLLFITLNISAHKQHAHVLLTQIAYDLLKLQLGFDLPQIRDHLIAPSGTVYGGIWRLPYISSGAWMEDATDVVYYYNFDNPPDIAGLSRAEEIILCELIEDVGVQDCFVSATHFWEADHGDSPYSDMYGTFSFPGVNNSNIPVSFSVPNAYEKIMKYANGSYELKVALYLTNINAMATIPNSLVTFRYNSLADLCINKNLYITSVLSPI